MMPLKKNATDPAHVDTRKQSTASKQEANNGRVRSTSTPLPGTFSTTDFSFFVAVNAIAALNAPILDCDETFNYWEPTHLLHHGFGLQTWEYSPEYALRSWLYILLHAVPARMISLFTSKKILQFFILRASLAMICAHCQTRLYCMVSAQYGKRVARIFQIIMLSSTGIFYASVAYLPSSFAMMTSMLGIAALLDTQSGLNTSTGIAWFGIGAVVGWPFSAALLIPLLFDEVVALRIGRLTDAAARLLKGCAWPLLALVLDCGINTFFYHRIVLSPWAIVSYNIFSGSSRGPDIFGTEPWHFYLRNLLLNFNLWFPLALCAGPILFVQLLFRLQPVTNMSTLRSVVFTVPFYLWLAIFSIQPHKEERFMYPAYPFLCLNAAVTSHIILVYMGHVHSRNALTNVPPRLKLAFTVACTSVAIGVAFLRTSGTLLAFNAPLAIYQPLHQPAYNDMKATVCLGKEWYRFPSSYFLPPNMRAKFVKSAFAGLLPGQFNEVVGSLGLAQTWSSPSGMNDQNQEDPGKYVPLDQCSFFVDSILRATGSTDLEPNFISDPALSKTWERLGCHRFLDTSATSFLARILWVPDSVIIPHRFRRKWGQYCLFVNKANAQSLKP